MSFFMDSMCELLTPYKPIIGPVATVVTIGQFFAGALICKDISAQGNTKGFSSMPFIGGLVIGILMLKYALMLEDLSMFVVNLSGIILNTIYTAIYNKYSSSKRYEVQQPLMWGAVLIAVIFSYVVWENGEKIEYRYGMIVTVLMLLLLGSPLIEVREIIKKKDASIIPLPITFTACIVSGLWMLYGFILRNEFMVIQNFLGLILCLVQLTLYFSYNKGPPASSKKSKSQ